MNDEKVWDGMAQSVLISSLHATVWGKPGEGHVVRPQNELNRLYNLKKKSDKARKNAKKARRRNRK